MTQPDIADVIMTFIKPAAGSFFTILTAIGSGAVSYHFAQKYELSSKIQSASNELVRFVEENYSIIPLKYK